jgi:hypothetical protein
VQLAHNTDFSMLDRTRTSADQVLNEQLAARGIRDTVLFAVMNTRSRLLEVAAENIDAALACYDNCRSAGLAQRQCSGFVIRSQLSRCVTNNPKKCRIVQLFSVPKRSSSRPILACATASGSKVP